MTPTSGTTAAGTGATNFKVDFSTSSAPKTISFDEVLQPGWNLVQQGGHEREMHDASSDLNAKFEQRRAHRVST